MLAVSVLMSVYNGAEYLRPALDSLLDQTVEDFELIVVDDASTDKTPSILDEYEKRDDRISAIRNHENLRQARARNRGLAMCTAPLVTIADADDCAETWRRMHWEEGLYCLECGSKQVQTRQQNYRDHLHRYYCTGCGAAR